MRGLILTKKIDTYSVRRLSEELANLGIPFEVFLWSSLRFTDSDIIHHDTGISLSQFHFIIPRSPLTVTRTGQKKETRPLLTLLAHFCKEKDVALLNREFFARYSSFNKLDQQFFLKKLGLLGIPSTYSQSDSFEEVVRFCGMPFVAKLAEGSLGKEVSKISTRKEFEKFMSERKADGQLFLFQRFFPINSDYRVFFLNNQVLGIIERFNDESEWRTNIATSRPRVFIENKTLAQFGKQIGRKFHFDLVGIDILRDGDGNYRIIELNTLAQFGLLEKVSSLNVAKEIIEGLLQKTKNTP